MPDDLSQLAKRSQQLTNNILGHQLRKRGTLLPDVEKAQVLLAIIQLLVVEQARLGLEEEEVIFLIHLLFEAGDGWVAEISQTRLAKQLGKRERTIQRRMKKLIDLEFVEQLPGRPLRYDMRQVVAKVAALPAP